MERRGLRVKCRLDGQRFASEAQFTLHFKQTHRSAVESLLRSLLDDLDVEHGGNFFTKLMYCDFTANTFTTQVQRCWDYPSTLAPHFQAQALLMDKTKKELPLISSRPVTVYRSLFSPDEIDEIETAMFGSEAVMATDNDQEPMNGYADGDTDAGDAGEYEVEVDGEDGEISEGDYQEEGFEDGEDEGEGEEAGPQEENVVDENSEGEGGEDEDATEASDERGGEDEGETDRSAESEVEVRAGPKPPTVTSTVDRKTQQKKMKETRERMCELARQHLEDSLLKDFLEETVVPLCHKLSVKTLREAKKERAKQLELEAARELEEQQRRQEKERRKHINKEAKRELGECLLASVINELVHAELSSMCGRAFAKSVAKAKAAKAALEAKAAKAALEASKAAAKRQQLAAAAALKGATKQQPQPQFQPQPQPQSSRTVSHTKTQPVQQPTPKLALRKSPPLLKSQQQSSLGSPPLPLPLPLPMPIRQPPAAHRVPSLWVPPHTVLLPHAPFKPTQSPAKLRVMLPQVSPQVQQPQPQGVPAHAPQPPPQPQSPQKAQPKQKSKHKAARKQAQAQAGDLTPPPPSGQQLPIQALTAIPAIALTAAAHPASTTTSKSPTESAATAVPPQLAPTLASATYFTSMLPSTAVPVPVRVAVPVPAGGEPFLQFEPKLARVPVPPLPLLAGEDGALPQAEFHSKILPSSTLLSSSPPLQQQESHADPPFSSPLSGGSSGASPAECESSPLEHPRDMHLIEAELSALVDVDDAEDVPLEDDGTAGSTLAVAGVKNWGELSASAPGASSGPAPVALAPSRAAFDQLFPALLSTFPSFRQSFASPAPAPASATEPAASEKSESQGADSPAAGGDASVVPAAAATAPPFVPCGGSAASAAVQLPPAPAAAPGTVTTPPLASPVSFAPEEYNLDPSLCVVCLDLRPGLHTVLPQIFGECVVTKLVPLNHGTSCFVQFKSASDVDRVLYHNGEPFGVRCERPWNAQTSESGQKYVFHTRTRNAFEYQPTPLAQQELENCTQKLGRTASFPPDTTYFFTPGRLVSSLPSLADVAGLNPVAPEFHPGRRPVPSRSHSSASNLAVTATAIATPALTPPALSSSH
eukprot:TRINITY_DN18747_c0_g1_i1.p1 TRINITY_DN18747_c0_g1~~TRINITY_DN18747_c0_g1_i1.p1  ORF type:complete len:1224 (+),score=351.59 TRINITY_DN18747_c0_g1_i1:361-3672(+)